MVEGHNVHRIISDQPVQVHVLDNCIPGDPPQVIRLNGHPYAVVNEKVALVQTVDPALTKTLLSPESPSQEPAHVSR